MKKLQFKCQVNTFTRVYMSRSDDDINQVTKLFANSLYTTQDKVYPRGRLTTRFSSYNFGLPFRLERFFVLLILPERHTLTKMNSNYLRM